MSGRRDRRSPIVSPSFSAAMNQSFVVDQLQVDARTCRGPPSCRARSPSCSTRPRCRARRSTSISRRRCRRDIVRIVTPCSSRAFSAAAHRGRRSGRLAISSDVQLPHQQVHRLRHPARLDQLAGSRAGARAGRIIGSSSKPSIRIPLSSFIAKSIGPTMRSQPRSRSHPSAASSRASQHLRVVLELEEPEHPVAAALVVVEGVVDLGA